MTATRFGSSLSVAGHGVLLPWFATEERTETERREGKGAGVRRMGGGEGVLEPEDALLPWEEEALRLEWFVLVKD